MWQFQRQLQLRGGPSKVHEHTHLHDPIFFAKQSELLCTIHAYTLVTGSDPNTNGKVGFGCSVSHSRKGRQGMGVPGGARRRRRA
jgi:hypothetical protein